LGISAIEPTTRAKNMTFNIPAPTTRTCRRQRSASCYIQHF
jgi:hypothetical protein